jgi:hypothetical protein
MRAGGRSGISKVRLEWARRRKGSGDLRGLQSRRFGPSRVEWWVRLPHASANVSRKYPLIMRISERSKVIVPNCAALSIVFVFLSITFSFLGSARWTSQIRYALSERVSFEQVHQYQEIEPGDCTYFSRPIGPKNCHYTNTLKSHQKRMIGRRQLKFIGPRKTAQSEPKPNGL